ncbi:MAG: hypothetical protein ACJ0G5_08680 [Alphaproteobacteria bacterium]
MEPLPLGNNSLMPDQLLLEYRQADRLRKSKICILVIVSSLMFSVLLLQNTCLYFSFGTSKCNLKDYLDCLLFFVEIRRS